MRLGEDLKKYQKRYRKYMPLLAIVGVWPLWGGWLLLHGQDCGCFLVEKTTLLSHSTEFGILSMGIGLSLIAIGIFWRR